MNLKLADLYQACGEALALYTRAAPNRDIRLTAHSWLAASGEPVMDFNQALVDVGGDAEDQLRTFHQVLQACNLPALYFLTPTVAEQLAPTATALGLTFAGKTPVMVCTAADLPAVDAGHTLAKQVVTAEQQEMVCTILADAFAIAHAPFQRLLNSKQLDAPGFTVYLAYQGEQPVSTVATVMAGPLVGVWSMGTLPAWQRQGIGRALLGQVMAQARVRGAQHFYLWSTDAGQRLYEQLGYRTVVEFAVWTTGQSMEGHG